MLVALTFAVSALAADAPGNPLAPLDFLVGSCWVGEFPNGGGTDTHCFEPVYGGKFVRDRHVVRGKGPDYLGETIYGWDPRQQRIVFWYWSSAGVIEQGSVSPSADGLDFPEHRLTEPKELLMRTHWKRIDADHYETLNERKDGEAWRLEWKVAYRRTPAGK
ncbi:MAG TPA: hypothetical protein VFB32_03580 [Rudaea sp.]|nr:hypothetical protein [Rudaea sp.]